MWIAVAFWRLEFWRIFNYVGDFAEFRKENSLNFSVMLSTVEINNLQDFKMLIQVLS